MNLLSQVRFSQGNRVKPWKSIPGWTKPQQWMLYSGKGFSHTSVMLVCTAETAEKSLSSNTRPSGSSSTETESGAWMRSHRAIPYNCRLSTHQRWEPLWTVQLAEPKSAKLKNSRLTRHPLQQLAWGSLWKEGSLFQKQSEPGPELDSVGE